MCGIGFFARYKTKKVDVALIKDTFEALESRGTDASGIYYERIEKIKGKDTVVVKAIKAPFKASDLWPVIQDSKHAINGSEYFIMLHSRNKTQGTEYKNVNNHPVFSKQYALIHNGMVTSDHLDFYPYSGEVDSEVAISYIETFGIGKGLSLLSGSMAFIFKKIRAREFYIFRHTNPLNLAYNQKDGILCGTSLEDQLPYKKEMELQNRLIDPSIIISEVNKSTLFKISLRTPKPEIEKLEEISDVYVYQRKDEVKKAIEEFKSKKISKGKTK